MRRNKIFLTFLSALIFFSIVLGLMTRYSFKQEVSAEKISNEGDKYGVSSQEDDSYLAIYFNNNMDNLSQIKDKSNVIIKAKVTNDRQTYSSATLSEVDVSEVYKGNGIKKGDHIYIYEPSNFINSSYSTLGGYNLMHGDGEYILFLKNLKIPEGYKYIGKEAISFMPVSTYYSKYPLNSNGNTRVIGKDELKKGISYVEVKEFDLITENVQIFEKYKTLKKEVLQNLTGLSHPAPL